MCIGACSQEFLQFLYKVTSLTRCTLPQTISAHNEQYYCNSWRLWVVYTLRIKSMYQAALSIAKYPKNISYPPRSYRWYACMRHNYVCLFNYSHSSCFVLIPHWRWDAQCGEGEEMEGVEDRAPQWKV